MLWQAGFLSCADLSLLRGRPSHLMSIIFIKNSFTTRVVPTSLGKKSFFTTRISFRFTSLRLQFIQWSCLPSFGELLVSSPYLHLPTGWFCTLAFTGFNNLNVLIFLPPVNPQIIQNCLKAMQERKVFSVSHQTQGLRWCKVELTFFQSHSCHISDFPKMTNQNTYHWASHLTSNFRVCM